MPPSINNEEKPGVAFTTGGAPGKKVQSNLTVKNKAVSLKSQIEVEDMECIDCVNALASDGLCDRAYCTFLVHKVTAKSLETRVIRFRFSVAM